MNAERIAAGPALVYIGVSGSRLVSDRLVFPRHLEGGTCHDHRKEPSLKRVASARFCPQIIIVAAQIINMGVQIKTIGRQMKTKRIQNKKDRSSN